MKIKILTTTLIAGIILFSAGCGDRHADRYPIHTISEVVNGKQGVGYNIIGATVYAVSREGFIAGDQTGKIYVCTYSDYGFKEGDIVNIKGHSPLTHTAMLHTTANTDIVKTGETYVGHDLPQVLDDATFDAFINNSKTVKHVEYTGTLQHIITVTTISGSSYLGGFSVGAHIMVNDPFDYMLPGNAIEGANVTVRGYSYEYHNGNNNIELMLTEIIVNSTGGIGGDGGGSTDENWEKRILANYHYAGDDYAVGGYSDFSSYVTVKYYAQTGKYYMYEPYFYPSLNRGLGLRHDAQAGYNSIRVYSQGRKDSYGVMHTYDVYCRFTVQN